MDLRLYQPQKTSSTSETKVEADDVDIYLHKKAWLDSFKLDIGMREGRLYLIGNRCQSQKTSSTSETKVEADDVYMGVHKEAESL